MAGQMIGVMNSNTFTERFIATLVLEAAVRKFRLQTIGQAATKA
jgi:hypothetical protein